MIRVLIAEDMHLIRGALVAPLSFEPDMEVVAELDCGDQVVPAALRLKPDVALAAGIRKNRRRPAGHRPGTHRRRPKTGPSPPTARETDVLRAAQTGISTDKVGTQLALSPATVRSYLSMPSSRSVVATASTRSGSPATPAGYHRDPGRSHRKCIDLLRPDPDDQAEHLGGLERRVLAEVFARQSLWQRLGRVFSEFGGAADLYRVVRVSGIEDRKADPRIPGQVACLALACGGGEHHGVTVTRDPYHGRLRRAVGIQRRHGGEVPAVQQVAGYLVQHRGWSCRAGLGGLAGQVVHSMAPGAVSAAASPLSATGPGAAAARCRRSGMSAMASKTATETAA